MKSYIVIFTLFVLAILPFSLSASAEPDEIMRAKKALQEKNYKLAVTLLQDARARGEETDDLTYHLAIGFYHSGRYEESRFEFQRLLEAPGFRATALFNLGLISVKQNDYFAARNYFERARDEDKEGTVQPLAEVMLQRLALDNDNHNDIQQSSFGLVMVNMGMEDQLLAPDTGDVAEKQLNTYIDAFAFGSTPVLVERMDRLAASAALFAMHNVEFPSYDLAFGSLAIEKNWQMRNWISSVETSVLLMQLGSDLYETTMQPSLKIKRKLNPLLEFTGKYRYAFHQSLANEFNYIDGSQHRLNALLTQDLSWFSLKVEYEFEVNDRMDKAEENLFYSYSPTRHRIQSEMKSQMFWRVYATLLLDYRYSYYDKENITTEGAARRREDRYRWMGRLVHRVNQDFSIKLEYAFTKNDASIGSYAYERNEYIAGLDYTF